MLRPVSIPCQATNTLASAHEGSINALRLSNDGGYCMSASSDRQVKLWNPHNKRLIKVYKGHSYEVFDVCIASDNKAFSSAGQDKAILVWDVLGESPVRRLRGHNDRVNCVSYNFNDTVLASGSYDSTVKFWDLKSNSVIPLQTLTSFTDSVTSLQLVETYLLTGCVDGYLRTFDLRKGLLTTDCIFAPITKVQLSPDKKCVLVQTLDSAIRLMDRRTGELLSKFTEHSNVQYKVGSCISNTGEFVISGSETAEVHIYDIVTSKVLFKGTGGHRGCTTCVEYHPKECCFVTAATDSSIKLWTVPNSSSGTDAAAGS